MTVILWMVSALLVAKTAFNLSQWYQDHQSDEFKLHPRMFRKMGVVLIPLIIALLVAGWALMRSVESETASTIWMITGAVAALAMLVFGLMVQLYRRTPTGALLLLCAVACVLISFGSIAWQLAYQ